MQALPVEDGMAGLDQANNGSEARSHVLKGVGGADWALEDPHGPLPGRTMAGQEGWVAGAHF